MSSTYKHYMSMPQEKAVAELLMVRDHIIDNHDEQEARADKAEAQLAESQEKIKELEEKLKEQIIKNHRPSPVNGEDWDKHRAWMDSLGSMDSITWNRAKRLQERSQRMEALLLNLLSQGMISQSLYMNATGNDRETTMELLKDQDHE